MEKYIYKITNKINGLIYIGQTINPKNRYKDHFLTNHENGNEKEKLLYQDLTPETKNNFS